jgi:erythromycin esterase-like protein
MVSTSTTCAGRSQLLSYLEEVDPAAARIARARSGCLPPWQNECPTYGRAVLTEAYRKCEAEVIEQCRDLLRRGLDYAAEEGTRFLDAAQNARLIASAERYYRMMYYGGAESWNLRDTHMFETLEHLLDARGPEAKALSGRTTPISATRAGPIWARSGASSILASFAASAGARPRH